ncbi:MAG: TetR/AcrR family transcriptional regulator [Bacteroidales bacterium]|nr:TetR/AcrR family transcriptional regulator [Bacteroidales bacterium]
MVWELYAKYGIKSITMNDVARHLGISKKTLYKYVNDKYDLVGKVIDFEIELFKRGWPVLKNAIEDLLIVSKILNQRMKEINPSTIYDLRKYYPQHYEKLTMARRKKMFENVIANIKKGQEEGLYRTDLDQRIIAMLQISRVENTVDNDLFSINKFTFDKFFF